MSHFNNWLPRATRHSQHQPASSSQLLSKAERGEREGAARAEQQRKTRCLAKIKPTEESRVRILPLTTVPASTCGEETEAERMLRTCSSKKVLLQCSAVSECKW
ncbi:hypothetical protein Q8A73_000055 [Channa argus]|nr:hypothetical protein Q8A73_000055 [Channa argus]